MNDAEKVREALHEPYKIRGDGKVSRKANEDAIAALDSILTELAEAKEHGQSYDAGWDEGWAAAEKRAEARIQELEAALKRTEALCTHPARTCVALAEDEA